MKQKAGSVRLKKINTEKQINEKARDQRLNCFTYDKNNISNHCENDTRWKTTNL